MKISNEDLDVRILRADAGQESQDMRHEPSESQLGKPAAGSCLSSHHDVKLKVRALALQ